MSTIHDAAERLLTIRDYNYWEANRPTNAIVDSKLVAEFVKSLTSPAPITVADLITRWFTYTVITNSYDRKFFNTTVQLECDCDGDWDVHLRWFENVVPMYHIHNLGQLDALLFALQGETK